MTTVDKGMKLKYIQPSTSCPTLEPFGGTTLFVPKHLALSLRRQYPESPRGDYGGVVIKGAEFSYCELSNWLESAKQSLAVFFGGIADFLARR